MHRLVVLSYLAFYFMCVCVRLRRNQIGHVKKKLQYQINIVYKIHTHVYSHLHSPQVSLARDAFPKTVLYYTNVVLFHSFNVYILIFVVNVIFYIHGILCAYVF